MNISLEQFIINQIILRSSMLKNISLYYGKMGIILFLVHYFKHTGQKIFSDIADELMGELTEEFFREKLPIGFGFGLSGIGWGIEYLIQNGFTNDDSLEICEGIDKKILEFDPRRITDYSLDTGLEGVLHYILAHIKGVMFQHAGIPFDETYLYDIYQVILSIPKEKELSENLKLLSTEYVTFYENRKKKLDYKLHISFVVEDVDLNIDFLNDNPIGLKNGMAGYLIKNLIEKTL